MKIHHTKASSFVIRHSSLVICIWLGLTGSLFAHDPGLSTANLRVADGRLEATLTFARADVESLVRLDVDGDGNASRAEFEAARSQLETLARGAFEIRVSTRQVSGSVVAIEFDESDAVHFQLNFAIGSDSKISVLPILLARLPYGHRQYLSAVDANGVLLGRQMLSRGADLYTIEHTSTGRKEFGQFLFLGVEHILTGYDHLVFLFALLLAGGSLVSAGKIITSFTLAHSITLALATMNVIRLPASIVEPLIAISIVYVGVENLLRRDVRRRWLVTFAFGLVHGFGFASVLRELGVGAGGTGLLMPLFSFNLGVELGQLVIAGLAFPLIWRLRYSPTFLARYAPACSVLIILAGGYWFIERALLP
jgi:hydrogenase/urease accessory protein HupE